MSHRVNYDLSRQSLVNSKYFREFVRFFYNFVRFVVLKCSLVLKSFVLKDIKILSLSCVSQTFYYFLLESFSPYKHTCEYRLQAPSPATVALRVLSHLRKAEKLFLVSTSMDFDTFLFSHSVDLEV